MDKFIFILFPRENLVTSLRLLKHEPYGSINVSKGQSRDGSRFSLHRYLYCLESLTLLKTLKHFIRKILCIIRHRKHETLNQTRVIPGDCNTIICEKLYIVITLTQASMSYASIYII